VLIDAPRDEIYKDLFHGDSLAETGMFMFKKVKLEPFKGALSGKGIQLHCYIDEVPEQGGFVLWLNYRQSYTLDVRPKA